MTFVEQFGRLLLQWAKSRHGTVSLGLTTLLTLTPGPPAGHVGAFVANFFVVLAVIAGFVLLLEKFWERRTWPVAPPFAQNRQYPTQRRQFHLDMNAHLFRDIGGFLFTPRYFFTATGLPPVRLEADFFHGLRQQSAAHPTLVLREDGKTWWQFENDFWWENAGARADDVLALVRNQERRQRRKPDPARTPLNAEASPGDRRDKRTRDMQLPVYERDDGACVNCGNAFSNHYDHVIPAANGGTATTQKLQVMCKHCSQENGASI